MEEENIEAQQSIAHRMIHFFYKSMAIGRDAWDLTFWHEFQCKNPDVGMDSKTLRAYFFNEIMCNVEHLEGLRYEVLLYINPMFNRFREELLEHRDLVEGVDFAFHRDGTASARTTGDLPPILLKATPLPRVPAKKMSATATTEQILRFVSDGLSELLWREDERSSKPTLSVKECLQRTALLTQKGVQLVKCIEPGMSSYGRFQRNGFLDAAVESTNSEEYEQFRTPQGISTPLQVVHALADSASKDTTNSGLRILEAKKVRGQSNERQADGSYQLPVDGVTPNYAILKHVRSKKRRFHAQLS